MAVDHDPHTPLRRSKRGQPLLAVNGPSGSSKNRGSIVKTSDAVFSRETRVEDLSDSQMDKFEEEELKYAQFTTNFYSQFERNETTKASLKVYGRGKRPATETTVETYNIGDTVLVDTTREQSVAVITAMWKVVGNEEDEDEEYMNVSLHWFLKPNQLASVRARRAHLENEIYYTLEGNATVPVSMLLSRCTVSGDSEMHADFCCLSAIDARRGLYYEFNWEELHDRASEVPDMWDFRDQWDLNAQDILHTPGKHRVKSSQLAFKDDGDPVEGGSVIRGQHNGAYFDTERKQNKPKTIPGAKRKRVSDAPSPSKKPRRQSVTMAIALTSIPKRRALPRPRMN
ncbi:hypothetical protein NM688_g1974 [Phlebia brevispora]|uniref:Uncharacterized protein n=1 Tax=Phlebia brevispora TaxID=194682 RepID=A0ACC1TA69_9APHY|nr:hypothetical protein NM688_g1974 [Phlebia brevispora]